MTGRSPLHFLTHREHVPEELSEVSRAFYLAQRYELESRCDQAPAEIATQGGFPAFPCGQHFPGLLHLPCREGRVLSPVINQPQASTTDRPALSRPLASLSHTGKIVIGPFQSANCRPKHSLLVGVQLQSLSPPLSSSMQRVTDSCSW